MIMPDKKPEAAENSAAPDDWQRLLVATEQATATPESEQVAVIATPEALMPAPTLDPIVNPTDDSLACGLCYRTFPAEKLMVASKERFNWEASVVVCSECLTELKLEMRARSKGADLLLGVVWAIIGFVVITSFFSLAIWSTRAEFKDANFWQWIGAYFAFVPGLIIGRMVRYGVGKRHSLEQQLIAIFFTFAVIFTTSYVGFIAGNNNFLNAITKSSDQPVVFLSLPLFITGHFLQATTDFLSGQNLLARIFIDLGIILGLVVAYFSSEGSRIYTRAFVKPD